MAGIDETNSFHDDLLQQVDALVSPEMLDKRCATTYLREVATALHHVDKAEKKDVVRVMGQKRDRIRRLLGETSEHLPEGSPRRIALESIRSSISHLSFDQAHQVMTEVRERLLRATAEPVKPKVSFDILLQKKLGAVLEGYGNDFIDLMNLIILSNTDHARIVAFCFTLNETIQAEVFAALHELYPDVMKYAEALQRCLTPQYNLKTG